jgi:hypothetical protein
MNIAKSDDFSYYVDEFIKGGGMDKSNGTI